MRAAVLREVGALLAIERLEIAALEPRDVLVRIALQDINAGFEGMKRGQFTRAVVVF